ncbi:hypothetical protein GQ607_005377 [Colletotrichum asianum]|uniref:Uncharacterized protein n=1 Tax=Colletotrichum asianum TaxID=702518 RepID=A0A8H3WKL5_9PEZI|nr:hypothetical protein GQ607_005377 [Colletotrichum asianum]
MNGWKEGKASHLLLLPAFQTRRRQQLLTLPFLTRPECVQSIPAGHNSRSSIPSPASMARTRNYHQSNPNSPHRSHRDRRRWPPPASTTAAKRINTSTSPPLQEQEHVHDTARCQLPSIDSASVCFFVICIRHCRLISSSVQHHLCSRIQAMETLTMPIQITKHHVYRRHRNAAH